MVEVEVKKDPRYKVSTSFLKKEVGKFIKEYLPNKKDVLVGVVLVGKRKAKSLNEEYRKMDYIPAVLTFPYEKDLPSGKHHLGEIMICFPLARDKAIDENQELEEAISELLRHGVKNFLK